MVSPVGLYGRLDYGERGRKSRNSFVERGAADFARQPQGDGRAAYLAGSGHFVVGNPRAVQRLAYFISIACGKLLHDVLFVSVSNSDRTDYAFVKAVQSRLMCIHESRWHLSV